MRQTFFTLLSLCAMAALLTGCGGDMVLFNSKGQVGVEQGNLILIAFYIMLIVVIPAIIMSFWFMWKYRQENQTEEYLPNWAHSNKIEAVVWGIPILIIATLSYLSYKYTHSLDPYQPLSAETVAQSIKNNPDQAIAAQAQQQPVTIQVIAEQWKWIFIYPELNIATVNQIAFPVNTPVNFVLTSNSTMNSFFIPELGGQIYTMAGMKTKLHLIADQLSDKDGQPGIGPDDGFRGISANYSGHGFSNMRFRAHSLTNEEYAAWVEQVKASGKTLDMATFNQLRDDIKNRPEKPHPVEYFSAVEPNLFQQVVDRYLPSKHHGAHTGHQNATAAASPNSVVEE